MGTIEEEISLPRMRIIKDRLFMGLLSLGGQYPATSQPIHFHHNNSALALSRINGFLNPGPEAFLRGCLLVHACVRRAI